MWSKKYIHDFQQYETIRYVSDINYTCKISLVEAEEDLSNQLNNIVEFNKKSKPRPKKGKDKKRNNYESAYALNEGREVILNACKIKTFPKH